MLLHPLTPLKSICTPLPQHIPWTTWTFAIIHSYLRFHPFSLTERMRGVALRGQFGLCLPESPLVGCHGKVHKCLCVGAPSQFHWTDSPKVPKRRWFIEETKFRVAADHSAGKMHLRQEVKWTAPILEEKEERSFLSLISHLSFSVSPFLFSIFSSALYSAPQNNNPQNPTLYVPLPGGMLTWCGGEQIAMVTFV